MQQPLTCGELCARAEGQVPGFVIAGLAHVAPAGYKAGSCKVLKK